MHSKHVGRQTVQFDDPPSVIASAAIAGKKEGEGPLKQFFDHISTDTSFGEKTWEKAESRMLLLSLQKALKKADLPCSDVDMLFGGDLLNQCIGTSFAVRGTEIPFFGLYGACSTMAEALCLASMAVEGGYARNAVAITSSHFASAERQYRFPLEYGGQRTPSAQWTVTGAGAVVLGPGDRPPFINSFTAGNVVDLKVKDAANMGAAMAPAFTDTLIKHFSDTGRSPSDYDLIVSGDLGSVGLGLSKELLRKSGYQMEDNLRDCGMMIYDPTCQDVHAGGSGCGCSASVLSGYLLTQLRKGTWNRILFCATGALLSPVSTQQGESIPSICHAVEISMNRSEA